ncbi:MAG: autotransporter-associated beta strand repeat-containing protein [Verrucomicrobia bacterium]|nr:autotransporter-associated beta strand repeat-containing protein [Verrucomicrobiota bacterium]
MTKTGTGTVKLGDANTYTGATIINNGILRISDALSLGTVAGGTTVNASGEIELEGTGLTVNEPLTLNGGEVCNLGNINTYGGLITLTANSGVDADAGKLIITSVISGGSCGLTKSGPGTVELTGANTYTGPTTISAGTLSLSTGSAIVDTGAVSLANVSGATLLLNSSKTIGSLSGGGATGGEVSLGVNTLTVGDANNTDYDGLISGTGGLTKTGGGTLTHAGTNTYTGSTAVNAGKLLVNGSLASGSAVTVASAAKLGGTGTAAGTVAVNGTLAPGTNGVGTLNTGAESWNVAGSYEIEINDATGTAGVDPGWDLLSITGTLTVAATIESKFSIKVVSLSGSSAGAAANWNPRSNYRWHIATGTSAVSGFSADKFTLDTSAFTSYNDLQGGSFSVEQPLNTYDVDLVFTRNPVTADPFTIGRAWGTYLRIPVADVLAKASGGTAPYTLLPVNKRESADFVGISGGYILFAPAGNTNSILDYTVEDSATPTKATASSTITVTVTNAVSGASSIYSSGGGVITIRFAGVPTFNYMVQRATPDVDSTYVDMVGVSGITGAKQTAPASGIMTFIDATPPSPSAYYRLRQDN